MTRSILAVVSGYAVWTILWLAGGEAIRAAWPDAFPEQGPWMATIPVAVLLALSVVCSVVAGATTGLIGRGKARLVLITGVLLLVTGIGVQASVWSWMPLWFHLPFLLLILLMCGVGARAVRR